ncbi:MAG: hypothetical protein KAQ75_05640, partial [Bacteroidales bacterium]|nr:hypothetical protein [Bacteroidales bacterium]
MYFKINFSKNTIFFSLLLIISIILFPLKSYENNIGSPYIQRIVLNNYGFSNNNFSIIQDTKGIIYIGNTNGILQYDGSFWNITKVKGVPNITLHNDGKIYVGAYNQFGFIDSKFNNTQFISLIDSSDIQNSQFGQVTKMLSYGNSIYFCTNNKLFHWNGKVLSQIEVNNKGVDIFKVNDKIHLIKSGIGIFKLIENKFVILPNSSFFNDKEITGVLPYNEQLLIKTSKDKGFYVFDNYSVEHFKTKADNFISKNIFSHACELNDGNYAIGTELGGIIVINKKGEIITKIDETSGLLSLSVNYLYADNSDNLWVL